MTSPLDQALESALANYRHQVDRMRDSQEQLNTLEVTETAPRRAVSITVGGRGEIRKITFPTNAYKSMAPATLATTIMDTIGRAREAAAERVTQVAAPGLPADLDVEAVMRGEVDLSMFLAPDLDLDDGGAPGGTAGPDAPSGKGQS